MRKPSTIVLLVLCAGSLLATPAAAGPSIGEGTIKGRVFDRTCYGPCYIDGERRPFEGKATVEAYHLPGHELYGSADVEKSRFQLVVPPGTYRIRVFPEPRSGPGEFSCWQGSTRKREVAAGEVTRVRLTVENVCVA